MYSTGSKSLIRQLNRSAVLNLIKREGPVSRVDIARRLSLSGAAVTSIAGELEGLSLIRSVAQAPSTGGRPPTLLGLNPEAACVIGIKLAVDHLAAVVVDLEGAVLDDRVEPLGDHALDGVLNSIHELVANLRQAAGKRTLLGIGIGMPGVVDGSRGVCVDSPILGWRDVPVAERLAQRLDLPVLVDNDVNTLAVAEQLYGHGRNVDDFVTVTIGRGVGCGIVLGGQLVRGRLGGAGEFGHVAQDHAGPRCECGRRGCLEAFVGDLALVRAGREMALLGPTADAVSLTGLADGGESRAQALFAHAGQRLGLAVAGLVNLLSPGLVIVSGEGMRARAHIEPAFRAAIADHLFPPLAGVDVLIDPWDDTKWARGAAALVLETFFSAGRDEVGNGRAIDLAGFVAEAV